VVVQFPAFCPNCGLIFESRLLGISGNVTGLVLKDNREQCPRCGEWAELPDGTFDVVGDTIHVLTASELTRERLLRLETVLAAAQARQMGDDEAAQAVADEAPELAGLIERLRPKMGRALLVFLFAVVQILISQAVAEHRDHAATPQDVQQAVEQAVQQCRRAQP
jgi:ribosomal protein S27AE